MAELGYTMNHLLTKKSYFADLINGGIFHGKQILKPEDLELVPDKSGLIYVDSKGNKQTLLRYRDIVMKASFGIYFMIMACEIQGVVHYAMPVRSMVYDSLNYIEQLRDMESEHKGKGELKNSKGFLSGVTKDDKLTPVISSVLYLRDDWGGNESLYDMIGVKEQGLPEADMELLRQYLPDYQINPIRANQIEYLEQFKTDLQYILGMLKHNTRKTLLHDYVKKNQKVLKNMDPEVMMTMWTLMGEQKRLQRLMSTGEGEKQRGVYKAIDDLIADGIAEGKAKGEVEGLRCFPDLILVLARQNRQDLISKVAADGKLRDRLLKEYHFQGLQLDMVRSSFYNRHIIQEGPMRGHADTESGHKRQNIQIFLPIIWGGGVFEEEL